MWHLARILIPPSVSGLAGRIDSVTLDPDIDLPTIRIPATAVVGSVAGGQVGGGRRGGIERSDDEDPENPMLDGEGLAGVINSLSIDSAALAAIQPIMLSGVITPTLDLSMIVQPIRLKGIIEATVQYLTGADQGGGGQGNQGQGGGGGGGAAEDPVQRSQVAADLSTIAKVLENAAVSGNLNPALGDTPQVDIPDPNLDIANQPQPGAAHPQGFADALGNTNQFRPGGRCGWTDRRAQWCTQGDFSQRSAIKTGTGSDARSRVCGCESAFSNYEDIHRE